MSGTTLRDAALALIEAARPVMAYGRVGSRDDEQGRLRRAVAEMEAVLAAEQAQPEGVRWNSTVRKLMAEWTPEQVARYTAEHARLAAEQAAPVAQQGEAVASLYITADGGREMDDWRHDLPPGSHILYTAQQTAVPQPPLLFV